MFYTHNMINTQKPSSVLLIIGGAIFIAIGLAGSLFLFNSSLSSSIKGRFRYSEKATPITLISNGISTTVAVPIVTPTDMPDVPIKVDPSTPIIFPFKTFIHSSIANLETPKIPDHLEIPSINLVAPVVISDYNKTKVEGETFGQWVAPFKFAAGWHPDSALLGQIGNTVINGHHNEFGEVFGHLVDVNVGDIILVTSGNDVFKFIVANRMILPERFQPAEVRLENARWLSKTNDIRLTLVTCWPKESNTHRLIIVARPLFSN